MSYETYLNNRIADINTLKNVLPEMSQTFDMIVMVTEKSRKAIAFNQAVKERLEELFGRELHCAEVDVYVQLLMSHVGTMIADEFDDVDDDITSPDCMVKITKAISDKLCTMIGVEKSEEVDQIMQDIVRQIAATI